MSLSSPLPRLSPHSAAPAVAPLAERYRTVRARTRALAAPLSAEDAMVQSMPDASPAKWHLAHTTWFFEQFVLGARPDYRPLHADWAYLFNSYYQSVGPMHARPQRGLLSRPSLTQVLDYREQIDARMAHAFANAAFDRDARQRIELGLHHEQQHQELLLTDIKHALWCNPLRPAYRDDLPLTRGSDPGALRWLSTAEAIVEIGAPPWPEDGDFAYDNESPRHRVLLPAHAMAQRPVGNAEYCEFIRDGGYRRAGLWLSEGWARVCDESWTRPLYWDEDLARSFTLGGMRELDPHAPVCHLSYYEADAFARWAGARLPTEAEWEHAAAGQPVRGNFADDGVLHPAGGASAPILSGVDGPFGAGHADLKQPPTADHPQQLFGDVWEWTASAYGAYPGFRAMPGSLGEYNGKFMCGQWVLRGGSCASARDHLRASYRTFFYPPDRWQFSGLRLAKDVA